MTTQPNQLPEEGNPPIYKAQELTIEEVKAIYFNNDAIVAQPEPVYRLDSSQAKFYYTFDHSLFRPEYFMAVTTFLSKLVPLAQGIIDKMVELGKDRFEAYRNERAAYGTMMDIEFNKFLIAGTYDMEAIPDIVKEYHLSSGIKGNAKTWIDEFNKDITSFAQWVHDYNVKPLAIGLMLVSRNLGIGGQIDLACEMNAELYSEKTPLEKRKRVRALVDYKSGKSGFYETNILQLEAYKEMWEENFPEYPIDMIANYAGTNWIKEPNYNFKDHTSSVVRRKLPPLIELAQIDNFKPQRSIKFFKGILVKGEPVSEQYSVVDVDSLITEKMLQRL
jgi:hypothetical protein